MREKTKIIMLNDGWAFSEHKMLNKLGEYAAQGWILERASTVIFHLRKGEPQLIQYAMDYQPKVEDVLEYKRIFENAGWEHVCDNYGFYIFKADLNAKKIHSDSTLIDEWREKEKKKSMLLMVMSLMGLLVFSFLANYFRQSQIIENSFYILSLIMGAIFGVSASLTYAWMFRKGK